MTGGPRRVFRLPTSGSSSSELDEEIRAHLELRAEELERVGWAPEAAWDEAVRRFGPMDEARRTLGRTGRARDRRLGVWTFVEGVMADLSLAGRRARKQPRHAAFVVATLALGIALTAASFTVVERVLLRPLPFPDADRLVSLQSATQEGDFFSQVSSTAWHDWTTGTRIEGAATLLRGLPVSMRLPDGPARMTLHQVSPEFFEVFRPSVTRGRALVGDDADAPVVVVRESFWRDRLGAPGLPAELAIVGTVFDVVGVVRDETGYPVGADVWSVTAPRLMAQPGARNLINWEVVARLPDGLDASALKAELDRISDGVRAADPSAVYAWQVGVEPLRTFLLGDTRRQIWLLLGATLAVWVLAWLNLAGLSLARTEGRAREVSVRLALGAERSRVVRQILTEHLLIGAVGGLVGLFATMWLMIALEPFLTRTLPIDTSVRVGGVTFVFAMLLALLTGLLAGLVPAVRAGNMGRRWGRSVGSRLRSRGSRDRVGAALVVAEVALALTLLVSGGLLVQSFRGLVARDLGFDATNVWMTEVPLDLPDYAVGFAEAEGPGVDARRRFWRGLLAGLDEDGRVIAAGAGLGAPMVGGGRGFIDIEGRDETRIGAGYRAVAGDYFRALSIPTLLGRTFDRSDGPTSERVVVINQAMAERYWPDESPLGRRVRAASMEAGPAGDPADWLTVIGVVADVRTYGFDSDRMEEMFVLAEQVPATMGSMTLVVRGRPETRSAIPALLREAILRSDSQVPVDVELLEDRVFDGVSSRAALTSFVVAFGALALLLACVGLYGLLSYVVAQRTREMGIRAALGARRARLVGLVVGRSMSIVGLGVALGLFGAHVAARSLQSQLIEVPPNDPTAYLAAGAIFLIAALLAALVPAQRASRVDPLVALQAHEG